MAFEAIAMFTDIQGIIFDLHFTLIYWVEPMRHFEVIAKRINRTVDEVRKAANPLDEDYENGFDVGLDPRVRMARILDQLNVRRSNALISELVRLEADECLKPILLYPKIHWMFARLRQVGVRTALCANANPNGIYIAEKTGITSLTDHSVFSSQVGGRKPNPLMYEKAIYALRVTPRQTLYVDDGEDRSLWGAKQFSPELRTVRVDHKEIRHNRDPRDQYLTADLVVPHVADVVGLLGLNAGS